MKVVWKISNQVDCPRCDSQLVSISGHRNICPTCADTEINNLRTALKAIKNLNCSYDRAPVAEAVEIARAALR